MRIHSFNWKHHLRNRYLLLLHVKTNIFIEISTTLLLLALKTDKNEKWRFSADCCSSFHDCDSTAYTTVCHDVLATIYNEPTFECRDKARAIRRQIACNWMLIWTIFDSALPSQTKLQLGSNELLESPIISLSCRPWKKQVANTGRSRHVSYRLTMTTEFSFPSTWSDSGHLMESVPDRQR